MLFNIVFPQDDAAFEKFVCAIKKAYFDSNEYNRPEELTPNWNVHNIPSEENQIKEIKEKLEEQINKICGQESKDSGKYIHLDCGGNEKEKFALPFINRFHQYFLERKWNKPPIIGDLIISIEELVCLEHSPSRTRFQNCSKNIGNYNHFINVVLATARLINYFTDPNKITDFLHQHKHPNLKQDEFVKTIAFEQQTGMTSNDSLRIFNLMFAAFLHDIGKTIVDHRHGMEGAIILSEHTSLSWYQLHLIANEYKADFQRNDLLFIADLLNFHDQFGTLSTGEAGYAQLNEITECIKRYSLKHTDKTEQIKWSNRYLFDLWVLNVADIIVSVENKWNLQKELFTEKGFIQKIEKFKSESPHHIYTLTHDLHISAQLLQKSNEHRHTDIYYGMREMTQSYSDRHVIERINRLVCTCVTKAAEAIANKTKSNQEFQALLANLKRDQCLSESEVTSTIERAVSATRDWEDFCKRFSWIGQMDYSLGFFISICERALDRVEYELQLSNPVYNMETICS